MTNKEIRVVLIKCHLSGNVSKELIIVFQTLARRILIKRGFKSLSYLGWMEIKATVELIEAWGTYDVRTILDNPYGYYYNIIRNLFRGYAKHP